MNKTLLYTAAICTLTVVPALAGGGNAPPCPPGQQPSRSSTPAPTYTFNTANQSVRVAQAQAQTQAQTQAQSQRQTQVAKGGSATATGGTGGAGGQGGAGGRGGNGYGGQGYGGNGGSSSNDYSSSARGNTPDAVAPSISGGEPCTLSASAGTSFLGLGIAGGGSFPDKGCETRQRAALLMNMGMRAAAKQVLCSDTYYSNAFAQAGEPCEADVRRWQAEGYHQVRSGGWER